MTFDDSKTHYSENMSDKNRVVLIIDIERPSNIKTGTSEVGDSKELLNIIDYYKKNNIAYNENDFDNKPIENPYGVSNDKIDIILYGE